jgi:hypothetical protein
MESSVKVICSKFCHKLNEINHQRYFKSKHLSSMNLACLMLCAFSLMVCTSGVDEKQRRASRFIRWPSGDTYFVYPDAQSSIRFERLDNFLNSINTKTLDNRSAADVINEGINLVFEIVRLLLKN